MCELARNSVLMSGYTNEEINNWTDDYNENDISKTNVPQLRLNYRQDNLMNESKYINLANLHMDY
jgi:AMP deaminase